MSFQGYLIVLEGLRLKFLQMGTQSTANPVIIPDCSVETGIPLALPNGVIRTFKAQGWREFFHSLAIERQNPPIPFSESEIHFFGK